MIPRDGAALCEELGKLMFFVERLFEVALLN